MGDNSVIILTKMYLDCSGITRHGETKDPPLLSQDEGTFKIGW